MPGGGGAVAKIAAVAAAHQAVGEVGGAIPGGAVHGGEIAVVEPLGPQAEVADLAIGEAVAPGTGRKRRKMEKTFDTTLF